MPVGRRLFLLQSMLLGLTLCSGGCAPLPPIRQGIHRLDGELQVDGHPEGLEAVIKPNSTVSTGSSGHAVLVMGEDAFLLGEKTKVTFHPDPASSKRPTVISSEKKAVPSQIRRTIGFTLHAGKILSVFGAGAKTLKVPTAVIGIRGTGLFLQVHSDHDYMCLCYGRADIRMNADPSVREELKTQHHESPRALTADAQIHVAPMLNHTDEELYMLEALVNRKPAFDGIPSRSGY